MTRMDSWRALARLPLAALLALAWCLAPTLPAAAAEATSAAAAAVEDEEDVEELEVVQVTGTRILLPGVTSANPIDSITAQDLRDLGLVNVSDALLTLVPQNISTWQPGLVGDIQTATGAEMGPLVTAGLGGDGGGRELDRSSFFIGSTIANLRGLDPAFGSRTLTLIDGRRQVSSSSQADVVDMNIIPSNLLQRMDVVTGGASATYGSGAMAGVVNLVLNNRLEGIKLDMDYGVNQAGDGASPHVSLSGGKRLFGGRGHALFGAEWQDNRPIKDCAEARAWCAESRAMFTNSEGSLSNSAGTLVPLRGFEGLPARFQMENVRYNQFSPYGVIYENNTTSTSASDDPDFVPPPIPDTGWRFTEDGRDIESFAYGFRGARNLSSTMNGDGPLVTTGTPLRAESSRKLLFSNFEYNFSERTTGYFQGRYSMTDGMNDNRYIINTSCVRFNDPGIPAVPGASIEKGQAVQFGSIGESHFVDGVQGPKTPDPAWNNAAFRNFVGAGVPGGLSADANTPASGAFTRRGPPWMISFVLPSGANSATTTTAGGPFGSDLDTPPVFPFNSNVSEQHWRLVRTGSTTGSQYWNLDYIVISPTAGEPGDDIALFDPGVPAILPTMGRDAYAFLGQLNPEALNQLQSAFGRSPTTGTTNSATSALWGANPCNGFTAMRKAWNEQVRRYTTSNTDTWSATAGTRGRFGRDWRWDAYYSHGETNSLSKSYNGGTQLSYNFAMDAVIDDRATILDESGNSIANPTFNQPVCRITRDGVPQLDATGFPMSDPDNLAALAEGCQPLNIFGSGGVALAGVDMTAEQMAELQRQAIRYAFKDSTSDGFTSRQTLSFTTSGTLWQGWAGPLTGAFGAEVSQNKVDNKGTRGSAYLRSDLSSWRDSFGGKTRSTEGYVELNMPLVSGQPGLNLLSVNTGARYTSYYNKGGTGTTGQSNTQDTLNWKAQVVIEPFDFLRLRLSRSRDLRAADYRDLFLNQISVPDQASGTNFWREATEITDENRTERFGYISVGNPELKPEKSNTLTMGLVLSPGGWAQGMRFTADYFNIRVKDGIYTPFGFSSGGSTMQQCWELSGNSDDPDHPGYQAMRFDPARPECQEITFALLDPEGDPNDPANFNLQDVLYVNTTRPENALPYQRRGVDLSASYAFALNRAFERLPGTVSFTVRASRALESSGVQSRPLNNCATLVPVDGGIFRCADELVNVDLVGQIRSSVFIPGVSASPKWTGNIIGSYRVGQLTVGMSARYIGGAYLDKTWSDDPESPLYRNEAGQLLNGSVDNNWVKPYLNFALTGTYQMRIANLTRFEIFGNVSNLFDKDPPFTGGGVSGASAGFHDTMGRAYRMGVRMEF